MYIFFIGKTTNYLLLSYLKCIIGCTSELSRQNVGSLPNRFVKHDHFCRHIARDNRNLVTWYVKHKIVFFQIKKFTRCFTILLSMINDTLAAINKKVTALLMSDYEPFEVINNHSYINMFD